MDYFSQKQKGYKVSLLLFKRKEKIGILIKCVQISDYILLGLLEVLLPYDRKQITVF